MCLEIGQQKYIISSKQNKSRVRKFQLTYEHDFFIV